MATAETEPQRVLQLAQIIEQDIRHRGLGEGDAYLTSDEVGRMLGVHTRMASRAMVALARRDVLQRKRGVGTFVGSNAPAAKPSAYKAVHILITEERVRTGLSSDALMSALLEAIPGVGVQFNVIPSHDQATHVRGLIERFGGDGSMVGLILVGCPRPVQEVVAQHRIPAVVFGSTYPTAASLASLDTDHDLSGRLAARHLTHHGRERLVLLMHETWLPGDNQLVDGIMAELAQSGRSRATLTIRSVPAETSIIQAEVDRLVDQPEDQRPTGWIACGDLFARMCVDRVRAAGLELGRDVDIVRLVDDSAAEPAPGLPAYRPALSFRQRAARAAAMLSAQVTSDGLVEPARHEKIEVEIIEQQSN